MSEAIERGGGLRLAVERQGEGPLVVGLHGLTSTRRYVLMGSRALQRGGRRVVLYDARGHGASTPPGDGEYSYAALTADLGAVIDSLGERRALLAGVSMGAHTALAFALAAPERVSGLLLVTPAYTPDGVRSDLDHWDALARGLREGGIEGFVAAYGLESLPECWRGPVALGIRQRMALHEHPLAVADALEALPRSRPFADWAALGLLAVPTVVVGSRDEADPGHPLAIARRYAEAIPGARLEVEEEGRSPLAWQGGRLAQLLLDFP